MCLFRFPSAATVTLFVISLPVFSGEFWVDQRHPRARDKNPGTEDRPWLTASRAARSLQAGDTVHVKPGVYRKHLRPRGANLDIKAFLRGDVDGDGKQDIPAAR